jgi:TonB family protein
MSERIRVTLACTSLVCTPLAAAAQQSAPPAPPAAASQARFALGFNALSRCPTLRVAGADDVQVVVVMFQVGASGVPSQPSVTAPSGSAELDAAAMSCVLKLRFQPATRLGDGTAVESWQQMAWKWSPSAARSVGTGTLPPSAAAATQPPPRASTPSASTRAEVRVCVDESGRLTAAPKLMHPSGDADFDAAAIAVARSGSGQYRPPSVGRDGKPIAGCLQVAIEPGGP